MDLAGSALLLLLLSPVIAVIAMAVRVTSGRPILYRCRMVGKNGRTFRSWKFRTMIVGAETLKEDLTHLNEMQGPVFKIRRDPRITRLGRILRHYSLDELPQLWSVLKGDMSLVGPRPALVSEYERYEPWHKLRLRETPGLTCTWQISGRNEISNFDDWAKMDLQYIAEWSLLADVKILLQTVPAVVSGRGAY
jgi:lipopolysaccharide/colanic/teichoic acid biosynthesis glycosyltransferase